MLQINPYLPTPISLDDARPATLDSLRSLAEREAQQQIGLVKELLLTNGAIANHLPAGLTASNDLALRSSATISAEQFPAEIASHLESLKVDYIQREPQFANNLPADWLQKEILYLSASTRAERAERERDSLLQELRRAEESSAYIHSYDEHHAKMVEYVQKLREKVLGSFVI